MLRTLLVLGAAAALAACGSMAPSGPSGAPAAATAAAKVEVTWLGQAAFKITSPGGKVIVTDPWLRTNPLTPPEYKKLETFGKIDVLLVSHGHFDHIADAPALAQMYNTPLRAPGDLNNSLMTLGVLPANLLPRMNKGGAFEPVPGIKVTAVRAEHSSIYVWRNPTTNKDETFPGGEPFGWIIELENGFRIYHTGDTTVFGDMKYIGERYKPDLMLVPISGFTAAEPADAAYAARELVKPKVVIPMHYGTNPMARGTPAQFIEAMAGSPVRVIVATPGQALSF
jgi:L-ascorbate metabolism protein UlaG (beta-lactamase superfamily)